MCAHWVEIKSSTYCGNKVESCCELGTLHHENVSLLRARGHPLMAELDSTVTACDSTLNQRMYCTQAAYDHTVFIAQGIFITFQKLRQLC